VKHLTELLHGVVAAEAAEQVSLGLLVHRDHHHRYDIGPGGAVPLLPVYLHLFSRSKKERKLNSNFKFGNSKYDKNLRNSK
jgi:hypothetical protein